ncbi:hypothetical protein [Salisediminibacterium halotolerans]|uniref:DUF2834 domain-containing protein n=1 Tax=Salisediminibacterium halotolerans TaxID=517425 RepID=A0A1H9VQT8_9BACI|nr:MULTISPECIES: hypothetical protein [Salisediminibacterium]RLJ80974.1 hypothetical protein BCL39_0172 [Actinophytocola xinjiangensis]RPE83621.1 hypothetical protein EDD67_2693 [Salisediminibacterium halotolerans]TWG37899.1 hypothetical protein BCL52_0172 [Salisediminibacterium halotolerans]SES23918.1 hypothetical protein SAMN05444126_1234 [Salisediminibacterium haloalkalitolerans]GEL07031.1 hypothetical protein SHA02_04470 [Salisediminibacterium halotolerans]
MKAALFILLIVYAVFFAPGEGAGNDPIFSALISGDFAAVDPAVTAVFSSLGVYPALFLAILLTADRYRLPAWPFAIGAFGLGAFALLPWFIFRGKVVREIPRGPRLIRQIVRHPLYSGTLLFVSFALILVLIAGSWPAYREAFFSSQLVSVMTVDLFVLMYLSYDVFKNDRERRHAWLNVFPAVGPAALLLQDALLRRKKRNISLNTKI